LDDLEHPFLYFAVCHRDFEEGDEVIHELLGRNLNDKVVSTVLHADIEQLITKVIG
jgi:hypothetical protein